MARLTTEKDALVVRLVYDGPPGAGKTTSLSALGAGFARPVVSPAEVEGRTLYFDWLEYEGGTFEGIPIRCQVVSVPGQPELAARRFALLAEADAVVFVTHSTAEHLPRDLTRLSPQRCLALADTGWGSWRLWQVVRSEETLRQRLQAALRGSPPSAPAASAAPDDVVQLLRSCSEQLLAARATFRLAPPLPCRLELIGNGLGHPVYTGWLPPMSWEPPAAESSLSDAALLRREIQPLIEAASPQPPAVEDAWQAIVGADLDEPR